MRGSEKIKVIDGNRAGEGIQNRNVGSHSGHGTMNACAMLTTLSEIKFVKLLINLKFINTKP